MVIQILKKVLQHGQSRGRKIKEFAFFDGQEDDHMFKFHVFNREKMLRKQKVAQRKSN